MKKCIHIWFTKAGGGHESSAKTLKSLFEEYYPEYHIRLIDMYEMEPKWYQKVFEKSYPILVEKLPFVWKMLNLGWKLQWFCQISITLLPKKAVSMWFTREKPMLVISTYYSLGEIHRSLNIHGESKYITFVSDIFTPMRPWFAFSQYDAIVFSNQAFQSGIKHGVCEKNIHQFGLLVNPKFLVKPQLGLITKFRTTLNLNFESKTIMILGGGEGLPNGARVLSELLKLTSSLNIIVVCGRNSKFQNQCETLNTSIAHCHNVHIYGFINTIYELMSVSDLIITKAGPGAILEAAALGKYILMSYAIPPQELGNVDFVVEKGLGEYIPNAKLIVARLKQILTQLPLIIQHQVHFEKNPKQLVDYLIDKTL
jgi:UDP-N-acetylglucosamine:LPS N-acetylglucosamine transferase